MALARGSKTLLAILGLAYLIFLGVFFYQSVAKQGLALVPEFEVIEKLQLPVDPGDQAALQKFASEHVEIELSQESGSTGRYRVKELRASDVKQAIEAGKTEIHGALKSQAAGAESFIKNRYVTGAPVKDEDGKIVLPKAIPIGLMQIELLTKHGIAGKTEIPVQGHGQIISINATMGFVILNFLVLAALLYGLLWEPIMKMLDDRAASIRKDIEQASASREDAEKLKQRYEQAMANARSEANRLRQEKVREGDAEKDKIMGHAREEARRLVEDAQSQISAAVSEAKRELRKEVGSISVEIAARILGREVDQNVHRQMIDDFLRNLETEKV
jgi:F-type H+-transporting ATPase subunit b